ncbi:LysR family transcriptional regulator [Vibrio sp. SS-MA-C1-2]|uniref:LysR family transcriptional regulator n=1 Tax=Vibrio sp. SS-MA-C1-2 TaxID=2908646 RepID=UPI001F3652C3|nr:LysR family transcriptional regulator [Vibrio sp. SS-MA-C1-2]UJF17508.1 LysR family transcriptional regulator [Vibrio sp. SS-MA-C1-2]
MKIQIDAIDAFISVADNGSFSLAAKKLKRSQSNVSQTIQNLEIDLGFTLFLRQGRSIKLTANGNLLLKKARLLQNQAVQFKEQVQVLAENKKPILSIGVDPIAFGDELLSVFLDFENLFSSIELNVVCRESQELEQLLSDGTLDIIISFNDQFETLDCQSYTLELSKYVWIAAKELTPHIEQARSIFDLSYFRLLLNPQQRQHILSNLMNVMPVWQLEDNKLIVELCSKSKGIACIHSSLVDSLIDHQKVDIIDSNLLPTVTELLTLRLSNREDISYLTDWFVARLQNESILNKSSLPLSSSLLTSH